VAGLCTALETVETVSTQVLALSEEAQGLSLVGRGLLLTKFDSRCKERLMRYFVELPIVFEEILDAEGFVNKSAPHSIFCHERTQIGGMS
jgi:hypothetical protein